MVPDGEYQGWLVVGHHEIELTLGDDFGTPVTGTVETWSSLTFADEPVDLGGALPVGYGHPELWTCRRETPPAYFVGPLAGFQVVGDAFGVLRLLSPHEVLVTASALRPTPPSFGLALADAVRAGCAEAADLAGEHSRR